MANFFNLIFAILEFKIQIKAELINIFFDYFFYDKLYMENYLFNIFDKNKLLYYLNMYNFLKYIFYSNIKNIMLHIYYYIIQIFLFLVYNNMPNKFVKNYIYNYYIFKKSLFQLKKYIMLGYVKK